jgi:hypothetical protein
VKNRIDVIDSIVKKLKVKEGAVLSILNAPASFIHTESMRVTPNTDALIYFVRQSADIPESIFSVKKGCLVWMAYPKKSSGIPTDLNRDTGWIIFEENGWVAVSQVAIDADWSAVRFRPKEEIKSLKRDMDAPGIDRANKTVELPTDFKEKLLADGLMDSYLKLSFTDKKEIVLGITNAKKVQTRIKRIQQSLAQLGQKQG